MIKKSIRWRLPLTYAGIAVLATVCLGVALLITLRSYYAEREIIHLQNNAVAISESIIQIQDELLSNNNIAAQLHNLAFVTQSRLRILDADGVVILDSGSPTNQISFGVLAAVPSQSIELNMSETSAIMSEGDFENAMPAFASTSQDAMIVSDEDGTSYIVNGDIRAGTTTISVQRVYPSMYAAATTPYGFDLIGEVKQGTVSDQVVTLPLHDTNGNLTGYLEMSEGVSFSSQIIENVAVTLFFTGGIAIVIAGMVGWWISREISSPVIRLTNGAVQMARGDLSVRVGISGEDELSVMAGAFNNMASQVESTILALRRFVADAAHEMHTPLTALRSDLELAATDNNQLDRQRYIESAQVQVQRIESLTDNLLDLSRIESKNHAPTFHAIDLSYVIHELSEVYASRAEQANITFNIHIPDTPICVMGDKQQLRRVISNLLDNAIKFTGYDGEVTISARRINNMAEVTVCDTGIGIPEDDVKRVFNRFHRGRNASIYAGSGLGLAIIKAILDGHHGAIAVQSQPRNTRFTVHIPSI